MNAKHKAIFKKINKNPSDIKREGKAKREALKMCSKCGFQKNGDCECK